MSRPELIEQSFTVEAECHGFRLDHFLQKRIPRLSRSRIQRVIRGDCEVNGRIAKPGMQVLSGQIVTFRRKAPVEPEVPRNVTVLMTDPLFYALDKPAGLPVHPTAKYHYSTMTAVMRELFPGEELQMAHRLDRETSGILLVARGSLAGSSLKKAFARRQVKKTYLALVHGVVQADDFAVSEPLGLVSGKVRHRMGILPMEQGGASALTTFIVKQRFEHYTLVACFPHTGRQHQIRVHLSSVGHPIVGDKLYPNEELFLRWSEEGDEAVRDKLVLPRHALHAAALEFPHPADQRIIRVESPLPIDLALFIGELK